MIKNKFFKQTLNKFPVKGVYRVTSKYEDQNFQNTAENKLKQIAKENSKESRWFQESMQSPRGDSALQSRPKREIVLCKALCPV